MAKIESHTNLLVYRKSFDAAMRIYKLSRAFPKEELYSLTDQIRRSSRSVCANLAEAWRKRRYEAAFVSKLNDVEGEAGETQVWLQFAVECGCISREDGRALFRQYTEILRMAAAMARQPGKWLLPVQRNRALNNAKSFGAPKQD